MGDCLANFENNLTKQMEISLQRHKDEIDLAMNVQAKEIVMLSEDLISLKEQYMITEGRLVRAEKQVEDMREQLLLHEARSMRDNLVFYNIPESANENTESVLKEFLISEMKISSDDMKKFRLIECIVWDPLLIRGDSLLPNSTLVLVKS